MRQNNGYINPADAASSLFEYNFDTLYTHYFRQISELVYNTVVFENLPETVDDTFLKCCIFILGKAVFFKNNGDILALNAAPSNNPDVYYVPTGIIVGNPVIGSHTFRRNIDCTVVYCTSMDRYASSGIYGGLYSLIAKTATLLADNDLSINVAQKNTRLINIVGVDDSIGKKTIDEIMADMYSGKPYKAVQTKYTATLQSIPLQATINNQQLLQLIELHQYILAHFYEVLGLTTHDQIKKERLINAEINDNTDMAYYNISYVLNSIKEGIEKVNSMFGTDIVVKLNPILEAADGEPEEEPEEEAADGEPEEEPEEETADGEPEEEPEEEAADGEPEEEPEEAAADGEPEEEPEEAAADGEPEEEPEEEAADGEPEEEPEEEAADGEPEEEPEEEAADGEPEEEPEEAAADGEPEQEPEQEYIAEKQVIINVNGDDATVEVSEDAGEE